MLMSILKELIRAGKLLFFVLGNHETFSERAEGDSFFQLLDTASVPIANDRFEANVTVGGHTYVIDAMHKARGSSITNNQHGNMRNLIHNNPYADIIVSGHKHSPGYEITRKYGMDKHLITVGTYKGGDDYSWSGWPNGQAPFFPITRLSGEEKKIRLIYGIEELEV
jgi:predicted phosphodiesterase